MFSRLFIAALWSPAGLVDNAYCIFVTFSCGILHQVWYLIVSIPDLYGLCYFHSLFKFSSYMVSLFCLS